MDVKIYADIILFLMNTEKTIKKHFTSIYSFKKHLIHYESYKDQEILPSKQKNGYDKAYFLYKLEY